MALPQEGILTTRSIPGSVHGPTPTPPIKLIKTSPFYSLHCITENVWNQFN